MDLAAGGTVHIDPPAEIKLTVVEPPGDADAPPAAAITLTPEEARDIAERLIRRADMAAPKPLLRFGEEQP